MRALRELIVRILAHLRPGAADREINEEMAYHVDRLTERNIAAGMSPAAARDAARREFGNAGATGDGMRDAARWAWLSRLERDVRYALRSLRRAPLFAATVIMTMAVAIGLNATVFTFLEAYVLRPLAVRDPSAIHSTLVISERKGERSTDTWMYWDQYQLVRNDSAVVADALMFRDAYVRIEQVPAIGALVSGNYFGMLGVNTVVGRPILPSDVTGADDGLVIVLAHETWQARFGGDSGVVGRTIPIRGRQFTVVGVANPRFTGLREMSVDFWAPITLAEVLDAKSKAPAYPVFPRGAAVLRLQPGIDPEAAKNRLGRILARFTVPREGDLKVTGLELQSRRTILTLDAELVTVLAPTALAFLLVLAVACANVANMMLARGLARQRELGIRMALGAERKQVVGQLLAESFVLAVPAAVLGFAVSRLTLDAGMRLLMGTFPPAFAPYLKIVPLDPDIRVYLFLLALAIGTAVLFGLAPALQVTRASVVSATRGEFDGGVRPGKLRNALVIVQMAGCVLLMAVAGLLVRGNSQLERTDPGFDVKGTLLLEFATAERAQALATLQSLPRVTSVAGAEEAPARGFYSRTSMRLAGSKDEARVFYNRVTPEYFPVTRTTLKEGRLFTAAEAAGAERVVLVSETAARILAPGKSAIGLEVELTEEPLALKWRGLDRFKTARVIGVVADAAPGLVLVSRHASIAYYPMEMAEAWSFIASVRGEEMRESQAIAAEIERRHPGAISEISPMGQSVDGQLYPIKFASWIAMLLGAITIVLTLSGIYGVLSFLVAQRTREIGIRMSLGAPRGSVIAMILRQSVRLAVIGGAIGLTGALGLSVLFNSQELIVNTFDPLAYLATAVMAIVVCVGAAWVPSRRAASVNPLEALRSE